MLLHGISQCYCWQNLLQGFLYVSQRIYLIRIYRSSFCELISTIRCVIWLGIIHLVVGWQWWLTFYSIIPDREASYLLKFSRRPISLIFWLIISHRRWIEILLGGFLIDEFHEWEGALLHRLDIQDWQSLLLFFSFF